AIQRVPGRSWGVSGGNRSSGSHRMTQSFIHSPDSPLFTLNQMSLSRPQWNRIVTNTLFRRLQPRRPLALHFGQSAHDGRNDHTALREFQTHLRDARPEEPVLSLQIGKLLVGPVLLPQLLLQLPHPAQDNLLDPSTFAADLGEVLAGRGAADYR